MAQKYVIVIHGGSCWESYEEYVQDLKHSTFTTDFSPRLPWQKQLPRALGSRFKVFLPEMPNWQNAKYQEWKIWFEKAVGASGKKPILVGHSLGGIFLAKYFAETKGAPPVRAVFLISAPYKTCAENPDFGDFALAAAPRRLKDLGARLCFYQSEDDPVVEAGNLNRYREFVPAAVIKIFKRRGHFHQDRFPELVADIKSIK